MVFVDTSVWISALRNASSAEAARLAPLLEENRACISRIVRIELLAAGGERWSDRLARLLAAVPCFDPTPATWAAVESWLKQPGSGGYGAADLLIASVCAENGGTLWTLDRDFERMARRGWVKLAD